MSQAMVQIPIPKSLKIKVEAVARSYGSSLEEAVRTVLTKFVKKEVKLSEPEPVQLSPRAIKRYNKAIDEIRQGKGIIKAKDAGDFLRKLRS